MKSFNPFRSKLTTQITRKYDTPMTQSLMKCDVIAHRIMQEGPPVSRLVNNVIAQFTSSVYYHVEIYVGDGWSVTASQYGIHFSDNIVHKSNVDVFRLKRQLTETETDVTKLHAYKQVGKPYDYFATLLMPFASKAAVIRRSANEAWMCSELTAWCYRRAGIDLVPYFADVAAIAPVDVALSTALEYIGTWYRGQPVSDSKPAEPNRYQKKPGCLSRFITHSLINPNSSKDEFYRRLKANQDGMLTDSKNI